MIKSIKSYIMIKTYIHFSLFGLHLSWLQPYCKITILTLLPFNLTPKWISFHGDLDIRSSVSCLSQVSAQQQVMSFLQKARLGAEIFFFIGYGERGLAICMLWLVEISGNLWVCSAVRFGDILVHCCRESYVAPIDQELCSNVTLNRPKQGRERQKRGDLMPSGRPKLCPLFIFLSFHPIPQFLLLLLSFAPSFNLPLMCPWQCGKLF